jgi:4-alpha-glucanotransferase
MTTAADEIQTHYVDALGERREPPPEAVHAIRDALGAATSDRSTVMVVTEGDAPALGRAEVRLEDGTTLAIDGQLPADTPAGYHEIVRADGTAARLIVAPPTCFLPDSLQIWGWAIQLYAARSRRSWGIGDLADLRRLGRWAAKDGAGIALINPLAAVTPTLPQQASPYFPSSRRFRNPSYLRIEEVDGANTLADLSATAARGRALNRDRSIDRDEVFRLKIGALERIWDVLRRRDLPELDAFVSEQGPSLQEFAVFCALAERYRSGWRSWPEEFRHPSSAAVLDAARLRPLADRIRFHQWLQFQVDRQLGRASRAMPVMQDLPIGFDADGADAWAFQDALAPGISVGAPPDEFNTKGQNWGLPPFVPRRLRQEGYRPFIETIRACVRHAGGLRIDHVMGLFRLFWIPAGMEPGQGAYVRSNAQDLLAIVALESRRAGAVIVGEDLGTVEDDVREQLLARNVLSYRLLWFEKKPPSTYPRQALAAVSTHDLPTIAGLWSGSDLEAQAEIGLSPNAAGTREILTRVRRLTASTRRTPLSTVVVRIHEALATAPSRILTATLDDAMLVTERPNMPATTTQWPNWSIALPEPIESLEKSRVAARIARALTKRAPRKRKRPSKRR